MAIERIREKYFGLKKEIKELTQGEEVTIWDSRIWGATKLLVVASDGVIQGDATSVGMAAFYQFTSGENLTNESPVRIGEEINDIKIPWKMKDIITGRRTRIRYSSDS